MTPRRKLPLRMFAWAAIAAVIILIDIVALIAVLEPTTA